MQLSRFLIAAGATVAFGGALGGAWAQGQVAPSGVVRAQVSGHAYQNGGIGLEEVTDMNQNMSPFDLRITFSEGPDNVYVANVQLRVVDTQGQSVFNLGDAGPLTDVNLPAGRYRVIANFGGVERIGRIDVKPGAVARLHLHWPADAA